MFCKGPHKSEAPREAPASRLLVGRRSGLGDRAPLQELVAVAHLLGRGAHDAAGGVDVGTVGAELDVAGAAAIRRIEEDAVATRAVVLASTHSAGARGEAGGLSVGVAGLLQGVDGVGRGAAGRQAADGSDGGERQSDKTGAHSDSP